METIESEKRSRAGIKGNITKLCNGLRELIDSGEDVEKVKPEVGERIPKLREERKKLHSVHDRLLGLLEEEWERDEAEYYLQPIVKNVDDVLADATRWVERADSTEKSAPVELYPEDSASRCGSGSVSSRGSRSSVRKVTLEIEMSTLRRLQELEAKELELRQEKEVLLLRKKLAIAEAETAANEDRETEVTFPSVLSKEKSNAGTKPVSRQTEPPKPPTLNTMAPGWTRSTPTIQPVNEPSLLQYIEEGQRQQRQMLEAMHLPRAELTMFDGDPLKFWPFFRSFENTVGNSTLDDNAKLTRLLQFCTGKAKNAIQCFTVMKPDEGYGRAMKLLKDRFGDEYIIAEAWLRKVTEGPHIASNDGQSLRDFADVLKGCKETLGAMGYVGELNSQAKIASIVERLPYYLKSRWVRRVRDIRKRTNRPPNIDNLVEFVDDVAEEATDPVYGKLISSRDSRAGPRGGNASRQESQGTRTGQWSHATGFSTHTDGGEGFDLECPVCGVNHSLFSCAAFKSKRPDERIRIVREAKLCFNCLRPGHFSTSCTLRRTCSVEGCGRKHTKFLHQTALASAPATNAHNPTPQQAHETQATDVTCSVTGAGASRRVALPIVRVTVKAHGALKAVDTFALLDTGSTNSFCTDALAQQLGAKGQRSVLSLSTLDSSGSRVKTTLVDLEVTGRDGGHTIALPRVFSKAQLNINSDNLATKADVEAWSHLAGLDLQDVNSAEVTLLIGQDAPEALIPLEVRKGEVGGPYAVRTKLGWVVNGPLGEAASFNASVNFVNSDSRLESQLQRFWKLDTTDGLVQDDKLSMNDRRAVSTWEQSITQKGGHYELAIPFKDETPSLPPNMVMAQGRLKSLHNKLQRDPILKSRYCNEMQEMLSAGYAEIVPADDLERCDGKVWHLPHHPVYNPMKPDKLRVVFDCAATHKGTSLNQHVLQGPDLTNKLLGVLLRFRRESVALMADVKAMFHQVRVPGEDRDVLRFLWWPDGDLNGPPAVYRMAVHLFGGTWSPSCASFALRYSAIANEESASPLTVKTVLNDFYVDDCLTSVKSDDQAISVAKELREILAKGGFKLTKFVSNSPRVIETIPHDDRAKDIKDLDFNFEAMPTERALGVTWDMGIDSFTYKIRPKDKPDTKRGLLSTVSSMYDPLGYASPVVLCAKLMIQELSRRKLGWDDPLPDDMHDEWLLWQQELPKLESLKVDRCLKPRDFGESTSCELHHFSDASEKAYGTTSYVRMTNGGGDVHTSLLMAKSRLAPLKTLTIPRLELSAATLSVKMDSMLRKELDMPITDSVFWTDSTLVLQYIRNDDTRFHTFVANRVATIRDGSEPRQWHHVPGEQNPADDVSRGLGAGVITTSQRWVYGPAFLGKGRHDWPDDPILGDMTYDDPEVKTPKEAARSCAISAEDDALERLLANYSSWYHLKRSVAWVQKVKRWLRSKVKGDALPDMKCPLTVAELKSAEIAICRYVQERAFPDEIASLQKVKRNNDGGADVHAKRTSPLYKLNPTLNDDGLVCVGGRLRNSPISSETRFPIILPKEHRVVDLLVAEAHARSGHSGREYVLSLLREKYWLIGGRAAVRRTAHDCSTCKRQLASPLAQKMGDLPTDRVTPGMPPFTYVGVDYFGPFLVKRGRSRVKRYGCIFTCLTIRAIHIEVACSLDTDSFINALQRFMCRRGQPELVRSDNGTNFVGAQRELRKVLTNWNQGAIHEFLLQKEIRWVFNPPSASHMGGVWERQIRTVRKLMNALCKEQVLDDEGLSTLMCLVESIVNGRPITVVSSDPKDSEPLSPNHLLLLRGPPMAPCDNFDRNDNCGRKRWRQVHYLASLFWRRWTREYLPTLQSRHKWVEPVRNISVGDVVLVVDEHLPRNVWLLGRITEVYSGKDNLVRSAKVKTKTATLVRPITKLCLLESVEKAEGLC